MMMRIQHNGVPVGNVEWEPTRDDERQAHRNHSQSLSRLNERGGVSWCELAAILGHRMWLPMSNGEAIVRSVLAAREQPDDAGRSEQEGGVT